MKKITITERILKRPVTVFMMSLIVVGFGLFSLANLKVTLMPAFNIPVLAVSVNYQNVAPDDMSRLVVEPIEGAIMGVEGINSLESNVRQGGAFIILRMDPRTNIQQAEMKIREAIDRIRPQLPSEANDPVIFQFDPDSSPIMELSVESSAMGLDELRQLSIDFIEPRLERIPGVAAADTRGGLERNFYVTLDPDAMARHRIIPSQVVSAIQSNNVNQPIGNLVADRVSYSIRAEAIYSSIEEIAATIVTISENGIPVRVSDVARVENTYADINSLEEVNGRNSVKVEIQKQSDANTLDVAEEVLYQISAFQDNLPGSVTLQVLSNEGQFIQDSVSNLAQSALIALIVVILILLIFMGGWRIAFVVAMSIPVSLTATFAAMYFLDISLNIISITGLALAIGLLVDNSIVVSESIANKLESGQKRMQAALEGTNEVAGALLGSTLTTLAVFVPILAVSGVTGTITRDLALTISIAITSSYLASIILIPVLASLMLKREEFNRKSFMFRGIHAVEQNYGRILFWILNRKYMVALFVVGIIIGSVFLFRTIPGEFFPESDSGEYTVRVTFPAGNQLYNTATSLRDYTDQLLELDEVRTVITSIGRQRWSSESNLGEMKVLLVDHRQRTRTTQDIIEQTQEMLETPDVDLEVQESGGGGIPTGRGWGGRGVRLTLIGPDVDVLQEFSVRIEERLKENPNVVSVSTNRNRPTPELHYALNRERINRIGGVSANEIANAFGTQARGTRAGFFREEGREIPIQVRNDRDRFQNREDLFALDVLQTDDVRVPILGVGDFQLTQGLSRISRRDREVYIDLTINVRGDFMEHRAEIQEILQNDIVMPDGYRYDFTGSTQSADESSREMLIAFMFSLLLTYMVMASLFENLRDPFIIMFTVPLAFFGSLLFLFITNTSLSVPAYIGIVILVGIVVNNGIVLVDYIHQYTGKIARADKGYLVAFLQACKRRMRPIILTALTTIFSMIPLALEIGAGAETWSPLARSVIGGLTFATILTLFVVPAIVVGISKQRREWVEKSLNEMSK
ncbi:AcrB/AcrD/AcrF family protein [Rhodohalobacter sp. SW132]|uniref:efflux RND transporter permease subunit n=1 Tax=Rhodohalobacter sp. SW132 TaxID=2293433 RepID=UPI000E22B991|nr:efflux RND transporter permease subunit [Rhodohalobacter sp. SW132]REL37766.1 AcrB/AcrD/AcrF family protein [Rhodohalobacter sp. SW132]